jgi:hypothetical protein
MRGINIMVSDRGFRSSPTARNLRLRPHRGDPIRRLEPTSLRNAGGLATKHVGAPRSRAGPTDLGSQNEGLLWLEGQ